LFYGEQFKRHCPANIEYWEFAVDGHGIYTGSGIRVRNSSCYVGVTLAIAPVNGKIIISGSGTDFYDGVRWVIRIVCRPRGDEGPFNGDFPGDGSFVMVFLLSSLQPEHDSVARMIGQPIRNRNSAGDARYLTIHKIRTLPSKIKGDDMMSYYQYYGGLYMDQPDLGRDDFKE